jgi:16S rRNA processing protein RimM
VRGLLRLNCGAGGGECLRQVERIYIVGRDGKTIDTAKIESVARYKTLWLLKLAGCDTPEKAAEYKGCLVAVAADEMPEVEDGAIYWHQLKGLKVYTSAGEELGKIKDLIEAGSNSVIVVAKGKQEIMVPFNDEFIVEVDHGNNKVIVDLPPGLLDV